jgi:hypothetical protein
MTILHVILAAYVRVISERPALNRFIAGQRIYARNNIECVMTIKKEMSLESPDTCIKVEFDPRDNIYNVYKKFRTEVKKAVADTTDFDDTTKILTKLPGWLLRAAVAFLRFLDFRGRLPKALLKVSPFHGSMIITSMGSLGIRPIYHHIYDFGNLPVFLSYGTKYFRMMPDKNGEMVKKKYIDLKVVTDERICDGYYYASAFKYIKKIFDDPTVLDTPPAEVKEDID